MDGKNIGAGWWTPHAIAGGDRYFAYNVLGSEPANHKIKVAKLDASDNLTVSGCLPNIGGSGCFYSVDDEGHRQPSVAVDGDGYIHVFGSMHHTPGEGVRYWRSNQPNSVTGGFTHRGNEVPLVATTQGWTYPILATLYGNVFLLVRETDTRYHNKAAVLYRFSNSHNTWDRLYRVAFDSRNTYTVYPNSLVASGGALHIAYSWMDGGTGGLRHRGSYLKYVGDSGGATGTFYEADGTVVGVPRKVDNGDVYRPMGTGEKLTDIDSGPPDYPKGIQNANIAVDPVTGYPHILYRYRDKVGNDNFKVFQTRWNGSAWATSTVYNGSDGNTKRTSAITHDGSVVRAYYVKDSGGISLKESGGNCSGWSAERALTPGDSTVKWIAVVRDTSDGVDSVYSAYGPGNLLSYGRVPR